MFLNRVDYGLSECALDPDCARKSFRTAGCRHQMTDLVQSVTQKKVKPELRSGYSASFSGLFVLLTALARALLNASTRQFHSAIHHVTCRTSTTKVALALCSRCNHTQSYIAVPLSTVPCKAPNAFGVQNQALL